MCGLNFENIFLVGCMYKNTVKGRIGRESLFFNNGIFYCYDREVAYIENDVVFIYPLSAKYGNFIGNCYSKTFNKLVSICKEFEIENQIISDYSLSAP